jgi:hypothetical protein
MDFEEYHWHVENATGPLDRRAEENLLKLCGNADWALRLRAWLVGYANAQLYPLLPVNPTYLLSKVNRAHDGTLELDEFCQVEYDRMKRNFAAAKMLVVGDVT